MLNKQAKKPSGRPLKFTSKVIEQLAQELTSYCDQGIIDYQTAKDLKEPCFNILTMDEFIEINTICNHNQIYELVQKHKILTDCVSRMKRIEKRQMEYNALFTRTNERTALAILGNLEPERYREKQEFNGKIEIDRLNQVFDKMQELKKEK